MRAKGYGSQVCLICTHIPSLWWRPGPAPWSPLPLQRRSRRGNSSDLGRRRIRLRMSQLVRRIFPYPFGKCGWEIKCLPMHPLSRAAWARKAHSVRRNHVSFPQLPRQPSPHPNWRVSIAQSVNYPEECSINARFLPLDIVQNLPWKEAPPTGAHGLARLTWTWSKRGMRMRPRPLPRLSPRQRKPLPLRSPRRSLRRLKWVEPGLWCCERMHVRDFCWWRCIMIALDHSALHDAYHAWYVP